MMGQRKSDPQLFNYAVNLEKRVRANHPLRQVKALIDFGFVREEVAHCYEKNGNESVAPEAILKMMFLLFFDDIASERELMEVIGRTNRGQATNLGAPVKRASTRVEVPSVQLDGSAPQTVPTASPRGGVGSRHGVEPAGRNEDELQR